MKNSCEKFKICSVEFKGHVAQKFSTKTPDFAPENFSLFLVKIFLHTFFSMKLVNAKKLIHQQSFQIQ